MVSATHRNVDRHLHRLYGAREHRREARRAAPPAQMDDRFRLRVSARLWLLVRAARNDTIRWVASAHLAALIQCRRRTGATARARTAHSRAQGALPIRGP